MAESSGETVPSVGEDTSDIEAICLDINIIYTYGSTANIGQPVSAASQKLIDYLNRIVDGDIGTLVLRLAELSLEKQAKWLNVLARAQVEPCLLCNSKNLSEVVKYSLSSNNKEISANILDLCARGYNHNNASVIVKYASESLPSDHLALSEKAWEILENYIMNNKRSDLIVELFQSGQRYIKDSVKYMRYAALLVKVSAATSELFNECADVGAIDAVINMCKNDDVLTQMNCLDMLGSIGTTADGLQFLQTRGIFDWLIEVSCGPMHPSGEIEGPQGMDTLISAQCLRVLGNLFLNSSSNHYQMLQVIDPMKIKHLLSAVSQIYMDDRDEANKLTGTLL